MEGTKSVTTDGRVPTMYRLTREAKVAVEQEVRRRNAEEAQRDPRVKKWENWSLVDHIIRQALGLPHE